MELKARSIKLFCAVVETGSLLSAANQNAMSAPAASRAVSQLEDRLGCRLFDRSTKNLTLTEDGKAFYRVAKESMRAWHMLEDFPKQRASTKKQLRIAVLARHCSNVIIPAVAKILKAHEETLRITMDVHQSRDIYYSKFSHPFDGLRHAAQQPRRPAEGGDRAPALQAGGSEDQSPEPKGEGEA